MSLFTVKLKWKITYYKTGNKKWSKQEILICNKNFFLRFDVVLNTVGGVCHESCLKLCKPDGIVVSTVPEEIPYDDSMFPMSLVQSIYLKTKYLAKVSLFFIIIFHIRF